MSVFIRKIQRSKNCIKCPCFDDGRLSCKAEGKSLLDEEYYVRRPDWCPIIDVLTEQDLFRIWIPVSERLPDSGVHVLASCRSPGGFRYVCDAFYSAPKTEVCSYSDNIDMEYDEETDEYYMPEGWWEVIKNWNEYSCIGIEDTVTHWMPLPESPEGDR